MTKHIPPHSLTTSLACFTRTKLLFEHFRLVPVVIVLTLALAACGSQIVRGQPPFVSIASLAMDPDQVTAAVAIHNINGVNMNIDAIEIDLQVAGDQLAKQSRGLKLLVGPNSSEDIGVSATPSAAARDRLEALQSGDIVSLSYTAQGRVHTLEDGYLDFSQEGHMYPIPGRPSQFRTATRHQTEKEREKMKDWKE